MLISGKGRYAITAMMNLAMHSGKNPLSLADISQTQGISLSYLEQIFARLRKEGLVQGTRGRRGGYRLGRSPQLISLADVIRAVEDKADDAPEGENTEGFFAASNETQAPTQPYWEQLNSQLYNFLEGIDLAQSITRLPTAPTPRGIPAQSGATTSPLNTN